MGFLQDNLIPFFRQRGIVFRESRREADDVVSFLFDKPDDLAWKAGQYGLFTITHKKIKNATKPFSVSSAPAENVSCFTWTAAGGICSKTNWTGSPTGPPSASTTWTRAISCTASSTGWPTRTARTAAS